MSLITPSDYSNNPYVRGLNQMGHVMLGCALSQYLSIPIAFLVFLIIEFGQWVWLGANRRDMFEDLFFWIAGVGAFIIVPFDHLTLFYLGVFISVYGYTKYVP